MVRVVSQYSPVTRGLLGVHFGTRDYLCCVKMMSVFQPEEDVLDLSVRRGEKRGSGHLFAPYDPDFKKRRCDSHDSDYSRGSDEALDYKVVFPTDYSATVAVMQQRLYTEQMRNPQTSPDQASNKATPEPFLPQRSQHQASNSRTPPFQPHMLSSPPSNSTSPYLLQRPLEHVDNRTPEPFPQQFSPAAQSHMPLVSPNENGGFDQIPSQSITKGKATRPFKAYPKNPLSLITPVEGLVPDLGEDYAVFRKRMLEQVYAATGGITSNKNMKRPNQSYSPPSSSQDPSKDSSYWERRRKNNEAAKRSRDARRAKEDELAIRTAYLEQQNVKLRFELAAVKEECNKLRSVHRQLGISNY